MANALKIISDIINNPKLEINNVKLELLNKYMDETEFKQMFDEAKILYRGLGSPVIKITKQEEAQKRFRRSIYVSQPIKAGEVFTEKNIKIIRPCYGLHPRYWNDVLGCKAKCDLDFGHPLSLEDVVF